MSHFTEVKTEIRDWTSLLDALDDLKIAYEYDPAGVTVRGWRGSTETMPLSIQTGTRYDVGVRAQEDGTLEFVADWWALENEHKQPQDGFMNPINQRYAYHQVKKTMQAKGFSLVEETSQEDGSVRMVVRRWTGG